MRNRGVVQCRTCREAETQKALSLAYVAKKSMQNAAKGGATTRKRLDPEIIAERLAAEAERIRIREERRERRAAEKAARDERREARKLRQATTAGRNKAEYNREYFRQRRARLRAEKLINQGAERFHPLVTSAILAMLIVEPKVTTIDVRTGLEVEWKD